MKARKKFFTMFLSMLLVFTMMPLSAIPVTAADSTDPPPAALDQTKPVDETLTETDIQTETESTTTPEPPPASETPDGSQNLPDAETSVGPKTPPIAKAPARAGGTATPDPRYSHIQLKFSEDYISSSDRILLRDCEYIVKNSPTATPILLPADELEQVEFAQNGDYVALYYNGRLYLKGDLTGACIDMQAARYSDAHVKTMMIYVRDNVTLDGKSCLLYGYDQHLWLCIAPGKTLTINADRNQLYKYRAAIYSNGGDVTVSGGGTLNINYQGKTNPGENEYKIVEGIYGSRVSFEYEDYSLYLGSPTVNINMNNGESGPEGDAVYGIRATSALTVEDDAKLKIEVSGRSVKSSGESDSNGRVNHAIVGKSMSVLDNASVDIISHKNVVTDISLTGDGDALTVNTTGHLNIKNEGNVTFADQDADWNRKNGYPSDNIYLHGTDATFKIEKAEEGVTIDSYSDSVERWYTGGAFDMDWYWPVHGNITLGPNMYRGNHRVGVLVETGTYTSEYTWGSTQYIYSTTGVATVKKSPGLTMDSHAPADNPHGSQLYYAKVMEPKFNDIHVVPKGGSVVLVGGEDIAKGKFLYWYDALHPTGTETGTSWTDSIKTFTNIQQDMVLVPVRDPMKTGPTLSDVDYSLQWDKGVTKQTRYAYQDLTFAKVDNISTSGGYQVMLVPTQLPRYGENTYAVKDLKGSPVMGLRNSRLYADKNARGTDDAMNGSFLNIPTGSYRIAYYDDQTGKCFFSKPFTFNPPVAPPYIDPVTQIFDTNDGGTKTVKITAERGAPIKYSLWDYTKNKWGPLQEYNGPFEVNVTADQDVRIEAYAGPLILDRRSEVRYAVRSTGAPTVKYGDTNVGDGIGRYFYDSIELTVEDVPEGYEVWYRVGEQPSESNMGTKLGEDGKVTITDSGSYGIIYFKLAKAFTVDGVTYRKLSHKSTSVHLSKLTELPAPQVTVKTKEGGQTLIPQGNTYTMTENVVTVTLESNGNWPLNATIAYDTNGNVTPRLSQTYTQPFDVRGAGTLAVFTLAPKANGEFEYTRKECIFKLAESLERVPVSTYNGKCTAYYMNESGGWTEITGYSLELKVGTKVRVVPNTPSGQAFKKWEIGNYSEYSIWENTIDGPYNPELIFHVPKPINDPYNHKPKTLTITATFGTAAEASISGVTKVDLVMSKKVGESISLNYSNKEMRTISCQWWEGDSVGAENDALSGAASFDPDKTYTVQVTIKANPGAFFTTTAGVAIGSWGEHFTVPDNKIDGTYDTLTFTATPIRQINLTMPAPLTVGDLLPTIADVDGVPAGVTAQELTWPYIDTGVNTVPETTDGKVRAALTLKTDGTHPILVGEYKYPLVNGDILCQYARNSSNDYVTDGSTVTVGNIDLPVKAKGVEVSGEVKSYNPNNATTIQLYEAGHAGEEEYKKYETRIAAATGSGQMSQGFTFNDVAPGTYDLVVTKAAHLTYTIKNVVVGEAPIDLTWNSNTAISTMTLLCGDIDGNEKVNAADLNIVWNAANFNKAVADANNQLTDVNGDGKVNAADLNIVWNAANFNKGTADCTFEY